MYSTIVVNYELINKHIKIFIRFNQHQERFQSRNPPTDPSGHGGL